MSGLYARLRGRRGAWTLDAELHAPAGEVTALVGPSGAGKSTLLRALAGLERMAGEVRLGEDAWQDAARFAPPHRRAVGFVFQHGALLPHLSVRANLEYGRRRARAPAAELDAAVALLGLEPLLERSPARLSGGERQRVALGRALATAPALLLLDEPLTGLDAAAKAELLPQLRAVLARLAAPVVYVSHDPAEVTRVADRVLHLRAGCVTESAAEPADAARLQGLSPADVERLAAAALRAGLDG